MRLKRHVLDSILPVLQPFIAWWHVCFDVTCSSEAVPLTSQAIQPSQFSGIRLGVSAEPNLYEVFQDHALSASFEAERKRFRISDSFAPTTVYISRPKENTLNTDIDILALP